MYVCMCICVCVCVHVYMGAHIQVSPPFSQGTMTTSGFNPAGPPSYSAGPVTVSSSAGVPTTFSPTTQLPPMAGPAATTVASQPFADFADFPDFMNSSLTDRWVVRVAGGLQQLYVRT